jgi:repressor LexA
LYGFQGVDEKMPPLTEIQRKILRFIEDEIARQGSPPTLRALCAAFGFRAIGSAQDHLQALIQKGFLEKDPRKARGIRLARREPSRSIPILGAIAAGSPREAHELTLGSVSIPTRLSKKGELFALRVSGDSMIGAGIFDGDLVIARQQKSANHGEIVVALVEGAATVKRLEKREGRMRLLAENPKVPPIEIRSEDAAIQGKVVGVQRYFE